MTKELRTNMISAAGEDKQCLLLCGVCLAVCSIGPSKFDIVGIHRQCHINPCSTGKQCHINQMFHRQTVLYQPDVPNKEGVGVEKQEGRSWYSRRKEALY